VFSGTQLRKWYRHGEELDAGTPLTFGGGVFGVEAFVVLLDFVDVETEGYFAHGDEYVEIVEEEEGECER